MVGVEHVCVPSLGRHLAWPCQSVPRRLGYDEPDSTNLNQGSGCDIHPCYITILLIRVSRTCERRPTSSSESSVAPLPTKSNSRRTSSSLIKPNHRPIRTVTMDSLIFSRPCCTVLQ